MTFWLVLGVMSAAAAFAVMWPLLRRPSAASVDNDLAVYRDQLAEIERDLARNALAPADAEAARIEVSRRLLAAAERAEQAAKADTAREPAAASKTWRQAAVAALVVLPLGAIALYLMLGSPGLPGQPLAERVARAGSRENVAANEVNMLAAMVARVETYLAQNPDDGRGWEVLAPIYMRFERFDEAVKARRNAASLLGETGERVAALGEAMTSAAGGVVTPAAKAEFARALTIEPGNSTATLYMGLAAKQAGQPGEARRIWEGMIARAPADAEWIPFVRQAIASLEEQDGAGSAPGAEGTSAPAASAADATAPRTPVAPVEMPAEQRDLARGMVERLAARLAADGSDVDGWLRLMRSYMVLGEREKAQAAAVSARRALAGDPEKLQRLDSGVKELGVEGS